MDYEPNNLPLPPFLLLAFHTREGKKQVYLSSRNETILILVKNLECFPELLLRIGVLNVLELGKLEEKYYIEHPANY